ncbi:MAG: glycosyltransferase family 2 protein [Thermodesulfovibrionia bacterium]|nr:glycosyltransferase family 2 protein [Thermodesulfovibrionia bacterium]
MDVTTISNRSAWKVTVIVPALNEEATIRQVLNDVRNYADELLVIDGNSIDQTRQIAEDMGVTVICDNGRGKGAALRQGLQVASHPIVVFIDADGSHEASDIPKLIEPIRNGQADIVIGCRMTGGSDELFSDAKEFIRLTGSMIINLAINYRWKSRLSDTQNGFRAVVRDIGQALNMREDSTTIEQEMTMKALARGYRVINVASHEYRRKGGETKVRVTRVWLRYVINILKHIIKPDVKNSGTASEQ